MQILLGDKLLDCINGNRLVDGASGAGILAASVTDTSADSREWILLLDESQCLLVFALGSLLQITLYAMCAGQAVLHGAVPVSWQLIRLLSR